MDYKTFSDIKTKIERELDLETEDFIQPEEFKSYVNDAIEDCQSEIHKLGMEDEYFLTKTTLNLVTGTADYDLPANIYANKIKAIEYVNGSTIYSISRLRSLNRFEDRARINQYNTITDYYKYIIRNDSAAGKPILELIPPSRETINGAVTVWYFRNANTWADDDNAFCDLPEIALQYVYAYTRYRCYDKEGHPNQAEAKDRMMAAKQQMVDVLANMIPDEDSVMLQDLTIYQDFS